MWMPGQRADLLANPGVVLVLGAGVDDEQVVVVAEPVDEDVVDERALRREQRGVVRLAVLEARGIVHGDVLHGGQRAGAAKLDLAHVAHVEEADAGAHGQVLGDEAAAGAGILDRHVPAAEVDHLGLEGAMGGVESGLFERGRRRARRRWTWRIPFVNGRIYPFNDRHRAAAGQTRRCTTELVAEKLILRG